MEVPYATKFNSKGSLRGLPEASHLRIRPGKGDNFFHLPLDNHYAVSVGGRQKRKPKTITPLAETFRMKGKNRHSKGRRKRFRRPQSVRWAHVQDSCYQPMTPDKPRPCPAQKKGKQGCDCATLVCALACCSTTPRDAEARFVVCTGRNQSDRSPNKATDPTKQKKGRGRAVYGYRSHPLLLVDPDHRFSVILADDFQPANKLEPPPVAALYKQLLDWYPSLKVDVVSGDAAFGTDLILHTVYQDLGARRVIDLRVHETDKDPLNWIMRGYDDKGFPLCPFGYRMVSNGYDSDRQ